MKSKKFKLIKKTVYFPEQKILAVGDLHIGYETLLKEQGIELPFNQLKTTKKELLEIINKIKKKNIKKIVFLGDIKHYFGFKREENFELMNFYRFLEENFSSEQIIFIKGNHDTPTSKNKKYLDYYIEDGIFFTHGHEQFIDVFDKKINTIVLGHLHPAVMIKDNSGIKKEKFKAFYIGKWRNKQVIILPSFLPLISGTEINDSYSKKNWSFIPDTSIKKFSIFVIGEKKIYDFGKLTNIN